MIRKYLLPLLAAVGAAFAIIAVILDNRPTPATRPVVQPPKAPFASYVAGTGIIEASSGNIAVGTPVPGIVTAIYVKWGDSVKAGDRLFKIDDRDLQARLLPALAKVKEAEARLEQAKDQLKIGESVPDKRAISFLENFASRACTHFWTMAVDSLTSMLGLILNLNLSTNLAASARSSRPAPFIPMVESPGDEVKTGMPLR